MPKSYTKPENPQTYILLLLLYPVMEGSYSKPTILQGFALQANTRPCDMGSKRNNSDSAWVVYYSIYSIEIYRDYSDSDQKGESDLMFTGRTARKQSAFYLSHVPTVGATSYIFYKIHPPRILVQRKRRRQVEGKTSR